MTAPVAAGIGGKDADTAAAGRSEGESAAAGTATDGDRSAPMDLDDEVDAAAGKKEKEKENENADADEDKGGNSRRATRASRKGDEAAEADDREIHGLGPDRLRGYAAASLLTVRAA